MLPRRKKIVFTQVKNVCLTDEKKTKAEIVRSGNGEHGGRGDS